MPPLASAATARAALAARAAAKGFSEYLRPVLGGSAPPLSPRHQRPDGGQDSAADAPPTAAVGESRRTTAPAMHPACRRGLHALPPIDRTPKLFIGGKQARPDSGYSRAVLRPDGQRGRRGRRGQPQGHAQRRGGGARRGRLGSDHGTCPRPDPLLYRREPRGARRRVRRAACAAMTGDAQADG